MIHDLQDIIVLHCLHLIYGKILIKIKKDYIDVNAHYIDLLLVMYNRINTFTLIEFPHDTKNIFDAIMQIIEYYRCECKTCNFTFDNANVNKHVINKMCIFLILILVIFSGAKIGLTLELTSWPLRTSVARGLARSIAVPNSMHTKFASYCISFSPFHFSSLANLLLTSS